MHVVGSSSSSSTTTSRLLALLEVAVLEREFRLLALTPASLVVKVHIRPLYDKQDTQMRVRLDERRERERERSGG